jgi:hypothetical protein
MRGHDGEWSFGSAVEDHAIAALRDDPYEQEHRGVLEIAGRSWMASRSSFRSRERSRGRRRSRTREEVVDVLDPFKAEGAAVSPQDAMAVDEAMCPRVTCCRDGDKFT